jgi:HlyD family secretion protein
VTLAVWEDPPLRPYGSIVIAAIVVVAGFFATVGGWAMFARLDAAIVSYGVLHADSERKTVEHLEGGILAELLVRAGDRVAEGQVVARLDATQTRELIAQLQAELSAARFAAWRLEAEDGGTAPDPLRAPALRDPQHREARIAREISLHDARLGAHRGQTAALARQIDQLRAEIAASEARVLAAGRQLALWEEERAQVAELVERGAAPRQRLLEFDRAVAGTVGERDEHRGLVEAARQDIARAGSEIRSLEQQRRVEIVSSLVEHRKNVEGLESRIRTAEDVLARHELRAPQAGRVVEITTVTPGAVIAPGEPLMTILPENDELVALTRLDPSAIDSVRIGGPARIRFTAYRTAGSPIVPGTIAYVSADALEDQNGETYFEARVTLDDGAMDDLDGIALLAGMPVEVSLTIGERRAGDYLLEPMLRRFARAFREE